MVKHRDEVGSVSVRCFLYGAKALLTSTLWFSTALYLFGQKGLTDRTAAQTIEVTPCVADARPAYQFPFLRFDEDWRFLRCSARTDRWDRIKYLPFRHEHSYLSLGGNVRAVYESYDHQYWGDGPQDERGWLVHHYLFHGDLHLAPSVRFFAELQAAFEDGRTGGPRPYDEDKLDLHQAFFDFKPPGVSEDVTVRVGRQELYYGSGRLVDARFGLNTRISFDGVKLIGRIGKFQAEAFATRPTLQRPGVFDDSPDSKKIFWGLYMSAPVNTTAVLDLYYLGYEAASQTFATGTAHYQSHTLGSRWAGKKRSFDYDEEINAQLGKFGDGDVRAWSVALLNGYTLEQRSGTPRISLRTDVTSGDNNAHDNHLGSFFPLYARGKYFGEADLNGPVNTIDVIPAVDLHIKRGVVIDLSYGAFWRESIHDGLYGFAGNLYKMGEPSRARMIGQQAEIDVNYSIAPHTLLRAVYQHFFAGEYLRQTAPGRDVNYTTVWCDYHF